MFLLLQVALCLPIDEKSSHSSDLQLRASSLIEEPDSNLISGFNPVSQSLQYGFQHAIGTLDDTLSEYVKLLQNPTTNLWSDTAFSAMNLASKELSVVAGTVRKAIDPNDWNTLRNTGNLMNPLMNLATAEAQDVVTEYAVASSPYTPRSDIFTRLETFANTLRSIANAGESFKLDISSLVSKIRDVETLAKRFGN